MSAPSNAATAANAAANTIANTTVKAADPVDAARTIDTAASPAAVPSPCVSLCQMHADTGWCHGCLRTLDEIAGWSQLDNPGKQAVLQLLQARRRSWQAMPPALRAPVAAAR